MPEKKTLERANRDLRQGKSASTAAGEFVKEEIEHVRQGKHGARSTKQAIAIGLSKARRAGVPLPAPKRGKTSQVTRRSAQRDVATGQTKRKPPSRKRSRAALHALQREPTQAASSAALSRQAKRVAARRVGTRGSATRAASKRAANKRAASSASAT
jgi:hypothetical protein